MGIFDNLSQAKVFDKSKFFREGKYLVRMSQCKYIADGHKGDSVVLEAEVLGVKTDDEEAPAPGTMAAHVFNISGDKRESGLGNLMQFLCAVFACDGPKDKTDKEWKEITNEMFDDNALAGLPMMLEVFERETTSAKAKNASFTVHKWLRIATGEDYAAFGLEPPTDE